VPANPHYKWPLCPFDRRCLDGVGARCRDCPLRDRSEADSVRLAGAEPTPAMRRGAMRAFHRSVGSAARAVAVTTRSAASWRA